MPTEDPRTNWQRQVQAAATHAEQDLRRVITYINDEVVPDLRRNGIEALRAAAAELHRLASRLDDHARGTPPPHAREGETPPAQPAQPAPPRSGEPKP